MGSLLVVGDSELCGLSLGKKRNYEERKEELVGDYKGMQWFIYGLDVGQNVAKEPTLYYSGLFILEAY